MKGWMYMLECFDGSYYTGSTNNLELRLLQHQRGEGANHTKKRLPVKLVYWEEYEHVEQAFHREKQVQGWNREKKKSLIRGTPELLPELAKNYSEFPRARGNAGTSDTSANEREGNQFRCLRQAQASNKGGG